MELFSSKRVSWSRLSKYRVRYSKVTFFSGASATYLITVFPAHLAINLISQMAMLIDAR